jgi:hypothetical protein
MVFFLVSCTSKLSDLQLDWQALNTLNRLRIHEDVQTVSPEGSARLLMIAKYRLFLQSLLFFEKLRSALEWSGNGISATETCLQLVSIIHRLSRDTAEMDWNKLDAISVSIDSASTIALLELVRRILACFFARVHHEDADEAELRGEKCVQIRTSSLDPTQTC